WFDLRENFKEYMSSRGVAGFRSSYTKLSLHTKLVLNMTLFLLIFGTLLFLWTEWSNNLTIGQYTLIDKLQTSFFQSATMRTAGFSTVNFTMIYSSSFILFYVLMFIGGSPGGTAGGVKTASVMLIYSIIKSEITQ